MGMAATNYLEEAERIVPLIDEKKIDKQEDYLFFLSIKNRVKVRGHVTQKQIFWLRDIKDKQLNKKD